jgi:CRISPR type I-D-associated protein Csc2
MTNVPMPQDLTPLKDYFVAAPQPIMTKQTIQIILMREALDYAIFRTEETREINKALTPASIERSGEQMERVAFLGSKQKAVESRELAQLLRTAASDQGFKIHDCWLKDHLCLQCPRCALFGGTNASSYIGQNAANIKHRIAYGTAFSLADYQEVQEAITFNAVSNQDIKTGQVLGTRNVVKPATLFPSIVSLQSVTWQEFVLALKSILGAHRYGAESRIGGDMRNSVFGIVVGWEEIITPLELTLELYDRQAAGITIESVNALLDSYKEATATHSKVQILSKDKVEALVRAVSAFELDANFLKNVYDAAESYRKLQDEKPKARPKK